MGSLSLLQQIFPTQELNQGLLHCRQILYQLSYEGSPEPGIIDPRSPPSPSSSPSSSLSPFHHLFHHLAPPLPCHHCHHQHPNIESGDGGGDSGEGCREEFSGHQGLQPRCQARVGSDCVGRVRGAHWKHQSQYQPLLKDILASGSPSLQGLFSQMQCAGEDLRTCLQLG